ncbi:MAG: BrnA antitoxin family protein [Candidatus Aminicenantes bacterium]|nr:BrnA antitoxin family protein [Candidatus Aminicenantes bacterium]
MSKTYDFSQGKRGAVVPLPPGKTRITIRLDNEVLEWFRSQVEARGGGSYQSMINDVLKEHVRRGGEALERYLRRIIREELDNKNITSSNSPHPPNRL